MDATRKQENEEKPDYHEILQPLAGITWAYRWGEDDGETFSGLRYDGFFLRKDGSASITFRVVDAQYPQTYRVETAQHPDWRERLTAITDPKSDGVHWKIPAAEAALRKTAQLKAQTEQLPELLEKMGKNHLVQQLWAARRDKALTDKAIAIHNHQQLADMAQRKLAEATAEMSALMEKAREIQGDPALAFHFPEEGVAKVGLPTLARPDDPPGNAPEN